MNAETLKALKGSIKKWEAIVAGTGTDEGPQNCPLCILFLTRWPAKPPFCVGCPVREITGVSGCEGTPYDDYEKAEAEFGAGSDECKSAAKQELEFLRSLLPGDTK